MYDKKTLVVIIVLLVIFVPLAVMGTYQHITKEEQEIAENVHHEFIFNNRVYFYVDDNLVGTYECSNCATVEPIVDDENYHTNYYKYGTLDFDEILSPSLAMFKEGDKIIVYNIVLNMKLNVLYDAIKTYGVKNSNNLILAQNGSSWQALTLNETGLVTAISGTYDYIGIPSHIIDDVLDSSKVIVKSGNNWQIIDVNNNESIVLSNQEIVDFNDNYYVVYSDAYRIYNASNNMEVLDNVVKKHVAMIGDYILIVTDTKVTDTNNLLVYENNNLNTFETYPLPAFEDIYFTITDNNLNVILDGNLQESIALE
mgnify:FL=1